MLRVTVGSAQISSLVRSGPIPASDSAAATFRFAGNPFAASRAVPSNILSGSVILDVDVVFDDIGSASESQDRLSRHHPDRMDLPDRCRGHGVEADQRAGRHHDLTAVLFRKL